MSAIFNYPHIGIFILAWFLADLIIPLLREISPAIGASHSLSDTHSESGSVSLLGGVGIFLAIVASLTIALDVTSSSANQKLFAILASSFFLVLIGTIDDLQEISAVLKLIVLAIITGLIAQTGLVLNFIPEPYEVLNILLTLIWLAGVTSAMNSIDSVDGVAGGITAIVALFTFLIAWKSYNYYPFAKWQILQEWTSYASIALFGGSLGFLRYNLLNPSVFLGDNGSLFLGFFVGSLAIMGGWSWGDRLRSFFIPCMLLTVPLFDLTVSTVLRWLEGTVSSFREAVTYRGKDHVAHRLMALGFSKYESIFFLYLMGTVSGALALFISHPSLDPLEYSLVVAGGIAMLIFLAFILAKAPVDQYQQDAYNS